MPRPKGSKVFSCPKCGERVIAVPGESGICGSCGAKTKLTKVLMAAQKPIARKPAGKKAAPAPAPAAEPKKRGRKPAVKVIEKPKVEKKRGRPPVVVETKKRGRPPGVKKTVVAPAPAPETKKRGRKPGSKKEAPNPQHIAPRILPPPKKTSK